MTILLRSVELKSELPASRAYPFSLPVVRHLGTLTFSAPVTLFVGENGSGKSTILEAIAAAAGSITVGAESVGVDPDLQPARRLAGAMRLIWSKRTRRGFFLRAEDFLGYVRRLQSLRRDLAQDAAEMERRYAGRGLAVSLGKMPMEGSLAAMREKYGEGLDTRSHGESFLDLFHARLQPGGLYLLDEPETPLSPLKQLSLLRMFHDAVTSGAQFIIATHSPILMAYPGACILNFDTVPPSPAAYDDLEHVRILRDFLNHRDAFLKPLFDPQAP
jgi:predicted ATPase